MIQSQIEKYFVLLLLFITSGCTNGDPTLKFTKKGGESPKKSSPISCLAGGDLVVSNSSSDAVVVLDSTGRYKRTLYNVPNQSETIYGITWVSGRSGVAVSVDGSDRVVVISAADCQVSKVFSNANFSGNLKGLTQLKGGDFLFVESNAIERFTSEAFRVGSNWPMNLQNAGTQLSSTAAGGFVLCSSGSDKVAVYSESGAEVVSRVSGIAGTTDAMGCLELIDGNIAVAWSGTTDTVSIYSSDLSTQVASFSNSSLLSSPEGLAQRANGNLLIVDSGLHHIIELTSNGVFQTVLGGSVLSTPRQLAVVPDAIGPKVNASPAPSLEKGDIVVSNNGSDSVLVLDSAGSFKSVLLDLENSAETPYGLAWSESEKAILVSVDGSDRVVSVKKDSGVASNHITDVNLNGTLQGLTQFSGTGDLLIIESNLLERFTMGGLRVVTGGWPMSLQTKATQISPTAAGGFVLCSTGTDRVAVYDSTGTQLYSKASGIAGTKDGTGCMELTDGTIAASWSGTTDTVAVYSADLTTTVGAYSNASILADPQGIAQRTNGNLLVVDKNFHHIIELTNTAGGLVQIIGDDVLSLPNQILVLP